jgi:uncharacterized protein YndB with AHSA1/START domain
MLIDRTLIVATPIEETYAYLRDFTTTMEWDPGTVRTTRIWGDGGVGTRYLNVSRFLGRETELEYVVLEAQAPRRLRLRASSSTVTSEDTMTLTATPAGGTAVRYRAEFVFQWPARILVPFLTPAFTRLGNDAEKGLRKALG